MYQDIVTRKDLAFRTVSFLSIWIKSREKKRQFLPPVFLGYREMSGISIIEYGLDGISARKIYMSCLSNDIVLRDFTFVSYFCKKNIYYFLYVLMK